MSLLLSPHMAKFTSGPDTTMHCKSRESERLRNLIQLRATIMWMSHSALRFELFFSVNSVDVESNSEGRVGRRVGGGVGEGGSSYIWKPAPLEHSPMSWERGEQTEVWMRTWEPSSLLSGSILQDMDHSQCCRQQLRYSTSPDVEVSRGQPSRKKRSYTYERINLRTGKSEFCGHRRSGCAPPHKI